MEREACAGEMAGHAKQRERYWDGDNEAGSGFQRQYVEIGRVGPTKAILRMIMPRQNHIAEVLKQ